LKLNNEDYIMNEIWQIKEYNVGAIASKSEKKVNLSFFNDALIKQIIITSDKEAVFQATLYSRKTCSEQDKIWREASSETYQINSIIELGYADMDKQNELHFKIENNSDFEINISSLIIKYTNGIYSTV